MEASQVPEPGQPAAQGHWDTEKWEEVVGGATPTKVTISLQGVGCEIKGDECKKGDIVEFRVVARIGGSHSDDKIDSKTDTVVDNHLKLIGRTKSCKIVRTLQESAG